MSPPTGGRGLKHVWTFRLLVAAGSPPTGGRGLKLVQQLGVRNHPPSPPTGGRGLKLIPDPATRAKELSPPTGGRGLKQPDGQYASYIRFVAPHGGAWIETRSLGRAFWARCGRPPRGGVD